MTTRHTMFSLLFAAFVAAPMSGCPTVDDDDDTAGDDDATDDDDFTGDDDDATDDDATDDDDDATDDDDDATDDDDDTAGDDDDDTVGDTAVDKTYFLDLADASFTVLEPVGLGPVLQAMLPDDDGAVFAAAGINGAQIEMLFGAAYVLNPAGDEVDWIWEQSNHTTTSAMGSYTGSSFDMQPFELTISISGQDVWLGDAEFTGTYAGDLSDVHNARISVLMDVVALSALYGADLCQLVTCETCPGGAPNPGDNCMRFTAEGGVCPLLEDLLLVTMP